MMKIEEPLLTETIEQYVEYKKLLALNTGNEVELITAERDAFVQVVAPLLRNSQAHEKYLSRMDW